VTELPISANRLDWLRDDSDRALVARAQRDAAAFAEIYRRNCHAITGYILRRIGDRQTTDDLVADVFLTAMRALPRYRYRGVPLRAWLYRIATNTVNRWARQRTGRSRVQLGLDRDRHESPTTVDAPPDEDDRAADAGRARQAMLTLKPKHQSVLALHYLEELSVEEVAVVLGCRVGTVKSRLSRARDALRERLLERR
jgi:RNA polymerase sigma-70 factor (ECF subfamily)